MKKKIYTQFMKDSNKSVFEMLLYNWKTLLLFSFAFMLVSIFCVNTFVDWMGAICFEHSGVQYIGPDNLFSFLTKPIVIALLLIMYVLLTFVNIFNISGLIYICRMSYLHKKVRLREVAAKALNTCRRVCHPRNWLAILAIMLLLKYAGIISATNPALKLVIPEFIEDFIMANSILKPIYIGFNIVLILLSLVYVFSFPIFVLSDMSFAKALKKSRSFFRYIPSTFIIIAITRLIFWILSVSAAGAVSALLTSLANNFSDGINNMIVTHSGTVTQVILSILSFFVLPAAGMAVISTLYFLDRDNHGVTSDVPLTDENKYRLHIPSFAVIMIVGLLLVGANITLQSDDMYYAFDDSARPGITAHRGDSINYPENTMPAFEAALEFNPEWMEFDVHQTKDDVIIVSHDDNILRVSGKDTCVHENTYADLMQLDVGSWFKKDFSDVRFSTLAEVLNKVKEKNDKIKLQIEIKPTEFDQNIEKRVTDIIDECGMTDRCIITSLKDAPLRKIKEIRPDVITVYSMALARGSIDTIEWSDYYTIEASNVTAYLVDRIHKANKKCFAWTVNTPENVQHLVDCNVDSILTDNPVMLREALDHADYKGGISKFIRMCLYQ